MKNKIDTFLGIDDARKRVTDAAKKVGTCQIPLGEATGRILAMDVVAKENVPSFDRSPLDGYAYRSCDVKKASFENPVTLKVIDYIAAGDVSHAPVTENTAVRLMTGAPIPEGADCVCKYEDTEFSETEVKIFTPAKSGENIIKVGEDVKEGTLLARDGMRIDSGIMGTLAGQNILYPTVYEQITAGIIATGSELVAVGNEPGPGMILDTNEYTLTGAMEQLGFKVIRYGIVDDTVEAISDVLNKALKECNVILITGGASVGDFDVTPEAMENVGIKLLFAGVDMKPGKACEYGVFEDKLVCGLSGHPSSSLTNLLIIGLEGLRKMMGLSDYEFKETSLVLANDFGKQSKGDRVIRGSLLVEDGVAKIQVPKGQGNVMISQTIGCDCLAVVPSGSGSLTAGTKLRGYIVR